MCRLQINLRSAAARPSDHLHYAMMAMMTMMMVMMMVLVVMTLVMMMFAILKQYDDTRPSDDLPRMIMMVMMVVNRH